MNTPKISGTTILSTIDRWRQDAYLADLDRAELMRHYNGGALEDSDDEAGRPSVRRANLLFGHRLLSSPVKQLFSTYNNGIGLLDGTMKKSVPIPPARRKMIEETLNREINAVIRESNRLVWPYRAVTGDSVIWGSSFLYRDDAYDWKPKYGRIYHDWDASPDITDDKFADFAILGELSAGEIFSRLERLKTVDDNDNAWDKAQLKSMAEAIVSRNAPEGRWRWPEEAHYMDPVAVREQVQAQAWGASALESTVPVYWYFTKRFDEGNHRPIDIYCVSRYGEHCSEIAKKGTPSLKIDREKGKLDGVLFFQEGAFRSIKECLFPFIVSVQLGGKPMMRRVMGLGQLNYDLDIKIQQNVHIGMEASEFAGMPLFQESDAISAATLRDLSANTIRPFDVLPAGVSFMDKQKGNFPYKSSLEYVGLLNGKMEENSTASYGVGDTGRKGRSELEVQVLQRQQESAAIVSASMEDWQRACDPMCAAIGSTILSSELLECDGAWPERQALEARLADHGISWVEVEDNFTFKMRRVPGHGDQGLALARAQQTAQVAPRLGPRAQQIADRNLVAAINGGDYALAMEMVPDERPSDAEQVEVAMQQNAMAMSSGQPPRPKDSDMMQIHVPVHLGALGRLAANARQQNGKWSQIDAGSFEALAAHAMADVKRFSMISPQQAMQAHKVLMQLVGQASGFDVGGIGSIDPVAAEKLAQGRAKIEQTERFKKMDMEKWLRTQEHREETSAFQENLQMAHLSETEKNAAVNRATRIATTALAAQPEPVSP